MARKSKARPVKRFDLTSAIIEYEDGELDEAGVIRLFQHLVNTGLAWQLQGAYGRAACRLIHDGKVKSDKDDLPPMAQEYLKYLARDGRWN